MEAVINYKLSSSEHHRSHEMLNKLVVFLVVVTAATAINNVFDPSKPRTCYSCSGSNCQRTSIASANTTCADNLDICVTVFEECKFCSLDYSKKRYLILRTFQLKYLLEVAYQTCLTASAPNAILRAWSATSALATCVTTWEGRTSSALSVTLVK